MKRSIVYCIVLVLSIVCIFTGCEGMVDESTMASETDSEIASYTEADPEFEAESESETEKVHIHSFSNATCTSPKSCSCGATEGSPLGHTWKDATCSEPKKCTVCSETSGLTSGHSFYNGKCTDCGKTDPDFVYESMVWIPTKGGTKYHSHSDCSGMNGPNQVTKSEAEALGFTPCKRCY